MKKKKLSALTGIAPDGKKYKTSNDFVLSRCPIGIEIEVENMARRIEDIEVDNPREGLMRRPRGGGNKLGEYWKITSDGSLRNNGVEFISDPIWGEDINRALDSLHVLIEKSGNTPDFSDRTSVHIHLDVRSLDTLQLFHLLVLVMIFERTLVDYCGGTREENVFCLPFYKAEASVPSLAEIVSEEADFIRVLDRTFKYNGFNIRPVSKQGSVEFRYHYGTMDKERIKEWINIIYCLKREATKIADIQTLPEDISVMGVDAYIRRVFGKYAQVLNTRTLVDDIYEGVRLAQEVIYADRQKRVKKKLTYSRVNVVAKANGKKALKPPSVEVDAQYQYAAAEGGDVGEQLERLVATLRR